MSPASWPGRGSGGYGVNVGSGKAGVDKRVSDVFGVCLHVVVCCAPSNDIVCIGRRTGCTEGARICEIDRNGKSHVVDGIFFLRFRIAVRRRRAQRVTVIGQQCLPAAKQD